MGRSIETRSLLKCYACNPGTHERAGTGTNQQPIEQPSFCKKIRASLRSLLQNRNRAPICLASMSFGRRGGWIPGLQLIHSFSHSVIHHSLAHAFPLRLTDAGSRAGHPDTLSLFQDELPGLARLEQGGKGLTQVSPVMQRRFYGIY